MEPEFEKTGDKMKSRIERSWITAVFSTFGGVGLIGLLIREFFSIELNLYVPLAAMMIVSGVYGPGSHVPVESRQRRTGL